MDETSPLADIRRLVEDLAAPDAGAGETLRRRLCGERAPNRLEAAAVRLAETQGKASPTLRQPVVTLFAAAHGIASHGVSRRTAEDVQAVVAELGSGGARLNGVCAAGDLGLKVFELAPHLPTGDFTLGPALDARACAATLAFGMEAAAGGADLLVLAGLAPGGATSAGAIGAALSGGVGSDWAGGDLAEHMRLRRAGAIDAALSRHAGHLNDPLEVLARLGGRETSAIAGAILAGKVQRAAVVLDGEAAAAAALVLHALRPDAVRHCFLAQRLRSAALGRQLRSAGLEPLLDLGIEEAGMAGAAAAGIVKAAAGLASAPPRTAS